MRNTARGAFLVRHSIAIHAPIERCFLLSTSLALVSQTLGMRPVAGRTAALVTAGDTVRWEGWQLGFHNYHVSLIEGFDPPHAFRDRMIAGRFRSFSHDHRFAPATEGTRLDDEVRFTMPFGPLGWMVGQLVLVPHIRGLLRRRFLLLKRIAESDEWRQYLFD